MVPPCFNTVSGLWPFHNMGQEAKRALDPLSSESKDHGTDKSYQACQKYVGDFLEFHFNIHNDN